jgi:type I restriction enzyme S subunit
MSDWVEWPLSHLADIRVSNVDKKSLPGEKPVLLCNYMDAYTNDYIRSDIAFMEATATSTEISKFKVDFGDVLITKDSETPDDIGVPAVVVAQVQALVCGYHLALLKPKQGMVDPVFLCKQLGSKKTARYFSQRAAGSTRYGLSNSTLANTPILLPPLAKQQVISRVLASIDTAIEKTEALIAKYQQIKTGLMHDLFTRGVLPNGQLRPTREHAPELYQETAIGWIPKEWQIVQLRDLLSFTTYGFTNPMPEADDGPFLVTAADVADGRIQYETCRRTTEFAFDFLLSNKSRPRIGDILLTKDGTLGRLAIVDREHVCVNQSVAVLRPLDLTNSEFIFNLLSSKKYQDQMIGDAGGSTIKHIYITVVDKMLLSLPMAYEERNKITQAVETISNKVRYEINQLTKLKRKKLGLMQDLLTGKVQVNIDASAPEPAHA